MQKNITMCRASTSKITVAKLNKNLEVPELVNVEERHNVYYFIAKVNNNLQVAELVNVFHLCITQLNRISLMKRNN